MSCHPLSHWVGSGQYEVVSFSGGIFTVSLIRIILSIVTIPFDMSYASFQNPLLNGFCLLVAIRIEALLFRLLLLNRPPSRNPSLSWVDSLATIEKSVCFEVERGVDWVLVLLSRRKLFIRPTFDSLSKLRVYQYLLYRPLRGDGVLIFLCVFGGFRSGVRGSCPACDDSRGWISG